MLYLSCYIHGNPEIHKIQKSDTWAWSSYRDYLGLRGGNICSNGEVAKQFEDRKEYRDLTLDVIKSSREAKEELQAYFLE